jgi:uncharacterized protein YtpQ (UPF0354 family)
MLPMLSRAVLVVLSGLVAINSLGCKKHEAAQPLAERVRDALVKKAPGLKVVIKDQDTLQAKAGEWEAEISLDNIRISCNSGESSCSQAINAVTSNVAQQLASRQEPEQFSPDQIRLTLKDRDWLGQVDRKQKEAFPDKAAENHLVREPLAADLSVVYVFDMPTGMRMLSVRDLASLKLDQVQVAALARKNLKAAFPKLQMSEMKGTGIWTNDSGTDYDSALLALPELWEPLAKQVQGPLVVGVPARNRLFATGGGSAKAVEAMRKVVTMAYESEDHQLSTTLLEWSPTGWKVYSPAAK